jgi:heme oxygenase
MRNASATSLRRAPLRRQLLQRATHVLHEELHNAPALKAVLEGTPARDGYEAVLRTFHLFLAGGLDIERAAGRALREGGTERRALARIAALEADLEALGVEAPRAAPAPASPLAAWNVGYCYVMRGSALGGRVLHRALDAAPDWAREARRFFGGTGENAAHWRAFCDALESSNVLKGREGRLAAGADAAFQDFRRLLRGCCS